MADYKPIAEWNHDCIATYDERKKLANQGRDVLVEEAHPRGGRARYRLVERSK